MKQIDQIMAHPLFKEAMCGIEDAERDRIFCRHGMEHCLDVARILYIMVLERNLPYRKDMIYATALLHDIGRYEEYRGQVSHHEAGGRSSYQSVDFRRKRWNRLYRQSVSTRIIMRKMIHFRSCYIGQIR